ncbi:MAG: glycosyltransferase family 4 protein [Methylobacteriaceae bacterium]|nr:glycosyltransferase family 4 protein [Methylobacteriaceae bacterium]MBV9244271.1 glycosyltransferase family 4 protein [Methylobacteriaceae bacterium]
MSAGLGRAPPTRLFMTADAVGGVWRYALDLSAGLARRGFVVTLAMLGLPPTDEQRCEAAAIDELTLIETGLPLDWTAEDRVALRRASQHVARMAVEHAADIVHLNTPALAADAIFPAPIVAVLHSCVATWWECVRGGPLPDDFRWRTQLLSEGLRSCDVLVVASRAFARTVATAYGLKVLPQVVSNGRQVRPIASGGAATEPAPAVFTAGRLWDEGKNIAVLDRAAARIDAKIYAAGPLVGPNGTSIACQHLVTLGSLSSEAIGDWLARRPVYVSTALYEPFGLAVLEAAQARCALVLSDLPTFRELWDDAALFVPPDDDNAIAAAIVRLLEDDTRRAEWGLAAAQRARTYSIEAFTESMDRIYRGLVPVARTEPTGVAAA